MLTALSLGAGGGAGFLPEAAGRLAGGAGGVGFALVRGLFAVPLGSPLVVLVVVVVVVEEGGGGGTCLIVGGAGGGGGGAGAGASSSR